MHPIPMYQSDAILLSQKLVIIYQKLCSRWKQNKNIT